MMLNMNPCWMLPWMMHYLSASSNHSGHKVFAAPIILLEWRCKRWALSACSCLYVDMYIYIVSIDRPMCLYIVCVYIYILLMHNTLLVKRLKARWSGNKKKEEGSCYFQWHAGGHHSSIHCQEVSRNPVQRSSCYIYICIYHSTPETQPLALFIYV